MSNSAHKQMVVHDKGGSCLACFVLEMIHKHLPSANKQGKDAPGDPDHESVQDGQSTLDMLAHHVSSLFVRTSHDFNVVFMCCSAHTFTRTRFLFSVLF